MDEPSSTPNQPQEPGLSQGLSPGAPPPHPSEPHPASARRVKRRLMFAMIGLYVIAIFAASAILMRPPVSEKGKKGKSGLLAMAQKQKVGWIAVHGMISYSESGKPWEKGVEQWVRRLKAMSESEGVKAIVLDINSPGGSVGAVQELYSEILRVRREKKIPVVALFGDVAASGGYYIAAACDQIVAHPGSLTGSIGVIFHVSNLEGLFAKIGYKSDPIKSGTHKDIGSPARPMTPEERAILQELIFDAYGQFVKAVSEGRNLPEETVKPLADGRIYSGAQALKLKLVDVLGNSTDAVELAGKLGGIAGEPEVKREPDSFKDFWSLFDARWQGLLGAKAPIPELLRGVGAGLEYRWLGW